jgi:hypothetical protein
MFALNVVSEKLKSVKALQCRVHFYRSFVQPCVYYFIEYGLSQLAASHLFSNLKESVIHAIEQKIDKGLPANPPVHARHVACGMWWQ